MCHYFTTNCYRCVYKTMVKSPNPPIIYPSTTVILTNYPTDISCVILVESPLLPSSDTLTVVHRQEQMNYIHLNKYIDLNLITESLCQYSRVHMSNDAKIARSTEPKPCAKLSSVSVLAMIQSLMIFTSVLLTLKVYLILLITLDILCLL